MSREPQLIAYADGSCLGNPGPGGWGVVLVRQDGSQVEFSGSSGSTTNNRMEITAAIEALRRSPAGLKLTVRTDSQYLVKTMTLGWHRRENLDLWKILDSELAKRTVHWEWVRGHSGDTFNERADTLARNAALGNSLGSAPHASQSRIEQSSAEQEVSAEQSKERRSPKLSNDELAGIENEAEIARRLRPLLGEDEALRRCANCHRAFVTTGNPPRMRAYCSLAACQLKRRMNS